MLLKEKPGYREPRSPCCSSLVSESSTDVLVGMSLGTSLGRRDVKLLGIATVEIYHSLVTFLGGHDTKISHTPWWSGHKDQSQSLVVMTQRSVTLFGARDTKINHTHWST